MAAPAAAVALPPHIAAVVAQRIERRFHLQRNLEYAPAEPDPSEYERIEKDKHTISARYEKYRRQIDTRWGSRACAFDVVDQWRDTNEQQTYDIERRARIRRRAVNALEFHTNLPTILLTLRARGLYPALVTHICQFLSVRPHH